MERKHFTENLYVSGHTACSGCGQSMAVRIVMNTAGKNTMVANSTGCLEVFSTKAPETAFGVPWIHSLFENSAAVASGIEAALKHLGTLDKIKVISQAGDGGTGDIGLQAISGMLERGHDILFVCYDNEAYMNTGIQRSGLTPFYANTTTSPVGKNSFGNPQVKKPVVEICAAHHIPYSATASVGNPKDIERKVKKALSIRGPKYLQIHVPCPLGWKSEPSQTIEIARLAVACGLYPLVEYEYGKLVRVNKLPAAKPVADYLKLQGRFRHLLKKPEELKRVQEVADKNIEYYGLK
ncbi:MAG: pyruvate ferredoxin oxidoreductase [Candidatus Omnitrophica bacterium]|nr:pyruvate ferredoxin oxidoreductase [Candidatus Omnitrophota bacterium]MBU2251112.1 pyruvate ferredoxin oxidoreductase [Candidatus Omnitrophota bacterium]MBU2266003.1 pyruvate ferredoxin oxidoreductase [Candidatus Omnitrophota bacterium]MBU2473751.1 pyruvate ferredoxin oxidoreductase [Candidatus Omnitrophota bacterium]